MVFLSFWRERLACNVGKRLAGLATCGKEWCVCVCVKAARYIVIVVEYRSRDIVQ